jgi:hypothetical protein
VIEEDVRSPTADRPVLETIDIDAILDRAVAAQNQKLTWRVSVVDLMKALELDSSLGARRRLAAKLGYHGDPYTNSAKMNVWLHKQITTRLAENGGEVPNDLKV